MAKYHQVVSKLESIKTELPNHGLIDTNLKYFKFASEYLQEEATSLARELRSWDTEFASADGKIDQFIGSTGIWMITDLIAEITDVMEETSPVLSAFDLFNPDVICKDNNTRNAFLKTLIDHYRQPITDRYENHTTTTIPVINTPQTKAKSEEFMEELDGVVTSSNEKLKKNVNQPVTMQKLKSSGVNNYLQANKITSTDVYKYLAADGTLKNYSNMALLF